MKTDVASLTGFGESGIVTNSGAGKYLNEFFMNRRRQMTQKHLEDEQAHGELSNESRHMLR